MSLRVFDMDGNSNDILTPNHIHGGKWTKLGIRAQKPRIYDFFCVKNTYYSDHLCLRYLFDGMSPDAKYKIRECPPFSFISFWLKKKYSQQLGTLTSLKRKSQQHHMNMKLWKNGHKNRSNHFNPVKLYFLAKKVAFYIEKHLKIDFSG